MENLVAIELAYINTKHPDFQREAALVSGLLKGTDNRSIDEHGSPIYRMKTGRTPPSGNPQPPNSVNMLFTTVIIDLIRICFVNANLM